jgi:hypothetical protein
MSRRGFGRWAKRGATLAVAAAAAFALTSVAVGTHYAGYHWARPSGMYRYATFVNNTNGWGIDISASDWNAGTYLSSEIVQSVSSCPGSNYHCVPVNEGNYGNTGWYGITSINYDPTSHHMSSASIKLNNYYNATATVRQHTACQETGHAQGLAHSYVNTSTCMNDSVLSGTHPQQHDWDELNTFLAHQP